VNGSAQGRRGGQRLRWAGDKEELKSENVADDADAVAMLG